MLTYTHDGLFAAAGEHQSASSGAGLTEVLAGIRRLRSLSPDQYCFHLSTPHTVPCNMMILTDTEIVLFHQVVYAVVFKWVRSTLAKSKG